MCYYKSKGNVLYFPRKLLSFEDSSLTTGFQAWNHTGEYIESHVKSPKHRRTLADHVLWSKINLRIYQKLIMNQQAESIYWCANLNVVSDVLIFLSARGF